LVQSIELLGNKKVMDLVLFFLDNSGEFSQVELIKKVSLAKATAVKWLKLLVKNKILFVRKIGPTNLYSLNKNHLFVKHIITIKNEK